jgi:hypothetical protein
VGEFHLIQEGWFLATQYKRAHRLYLKDDWSVAFCDPVNATMAQFVTPPNGNNVEFQVLGSKGYSVDPFSTGGPVDATFSAISTTGNVTFLASYTSSMSYHAYPASGGTLGSTGSGGLSLVALDSAGIIKFLTGGDSSTNERLRIDASGNFIASNVVTSAPSATLANSQYQFTVYDNAGTAVFEIRYKDASGTVKTGSVALT